MDTLLNKITASRRKIESILSLIQLVKSFHGWVRIFQQRWRRKHSFAVTINERDRTFYSTLQWVLAQVPPQKRVMIDLVTDHKGELHESATDSFSEVIQFGTHKIKVMLQPPKSFKQEAREEFRDMMRSGDEDGLLSSGDSHGAGFEYNNGGFDARLLFVSTTKAGQRAVIDQIEEIRQEMLRIAKPRPRYQMLQRYGARSHFLPTRDIDKVVLADGQMERIVADMQRFLDSEEEYAARGIPWHRGYLFYGEPGTGKTSLGKVLAYHFGLDLFYYPLSSATSDESLTATVADMGERSILLLEDIDIFKATKARTADQKSASLSGLLNVLDGVMTPNGLIKIMTTNKKDVLDPALLRPGRVDMQEHLSVLQKGQDRRLFQSFYGIEPTEKWDMSGHAPAAVMEIMKNNLWTPSGAEAEMRELTDDASVA